MPDANTALRVAPDADADCSLLIDTRESARRFARVEQHRIAAAASAPELHVTVALPASFEKKSTRRRYPLLILPDADDLLGSVIELSRALGATREARECIVVSHDNSCLAPEEAATQAAQLERIIHWCQARWRIERGEVAMFADGRTLACANHLVHRASSPVDRWIVAQTPGFTMARWDAMAQQPHRGRARIAWTGNEPPTKALHDGIDARVIPEATAASLACIAIVRAIVVFWGTGHAYGDELMPLSKPLIAALVIRALPLIRRLRRPQVSDATQPSRHVVRSQIMNRNFEIFVTLPRGSRPPLSGFPAMMALDGNGSFSCLSETAARMARAGEIDDVVSIGIGVPRAEGDLAFGLRRFEELSPPAGDSAFQDALGRFFKAVFAMFGQDARAHFGSAGLFHRFITEELLPQLLRTLPIDARRLCLLGHSAAGTFVAYERVQPDSVFASFCALSPGVAISEQWMLKPDGGLRADVAPRDLLVTMGGEERRNAFNGLAGIPLAPRYAREREAAGGGAVEFHCLEGETHTTVFPRALALALSTRFRATATPAGR